MKLFSPVLFLFSLYLFPNCAIAQQTVKINGIVQDNQQNLPAATVLLYTAGDSVLVTTAMTDLDGKFSFLAVPDKYYITCSSIGYYKVKTAVFQLSGNSAFQLPAITLREHSKKLGEISITASKPVLERKADKIILNVDAISSAAGLNALELLNKAPGVNIDQNENISLAGKSNVLITIDGKQTYLAASDVANLLKSMQSNEIESLEIINNPGSAYDANSTGGIINIKTKKGLAEGFNGNAALSVGFNKYLLTTNSINLNYRKKKYNVFGSYGYNRNKQDRNTSIKRITPGVNPLSFDQKNLDKPIIDAQNFKIGTDYFLTRNHTIGFLIKGTLTDIAQNSLSRVNIGKSYEATDSVLITPSNAAAKRKNFSYNLNYKGILDTAGQEITIDADYSTFEVSNNSSYTNLFYLPNGDFLKNGLIYKNDAPSEIHIKAVKADYILPINKKIMLNTGVKISGVKSDNNYVYENNINGNWIFDETKSNQFIYEEKIGAAYATLNFTLGKTSIQSGLRVEHTVSSGNSVTTKQVNEKKYTDLFPSLLLTQNFDADNSLNLSYSRKINRPGYQFLNPFIFYIDQYTYNQGNPNLRPEYSNNVEISYLYKKKYSLALAYSRTTDVISTTILQNENKKSLYQTILNLSSNELFSMVLNFPLTINPWWKMNNNVSAYYYRVNAPELKEANMNVKQFSASFYAQNNFTLNKLFSADAALAFNTPETEAAFKRKTRFRSDAGLRYNFPNKLGNLKLGVSDIFHTQQTRLYSALPGNTYAYTQSSTSTSIRITFTYRFGKMTVKSERTRSTGVDEEQKRLGG
ncbi:TonB-dependent receptor [Pedobacter sp. UYP1]|uniref:TonB-dependent receptor domain-containing protein n=1 Tax=Pedobacter sp. UYP1 TaxID=1756396 RepID=UPI003392BCBB